MDFFPWLFACTVWYIWAYRLLGKHIPRCIFSAYFAKCLKIIPKCLGYLESCLLKVRKYPIQSVSFNEKLFPYSLKTLLNMYSKSAAMIGIIIIHIQYEFSFLFQISGWPSRCRLAISSIRDWLTDWQPVKSSTRSSTETYHCCNA